MTLLRDQMRIRLLCAAVLGAGAAIVVSLLPAMVVAHSTGVSFEARVEPYLVDIGYEPARIEAGISERFDFKLWRGEAGIPEEYAHVWVRLLGEEGTELATGIYRHSTGPTTLLYRFPTEGDYRIEASYRSAGGTELVKAVFPFRVEPATNAGFLGMADLMPLYAVVGFMIAAGAGFWLRSCWRFGH